MFHCLVFYIAKVSSMCVTVKVRVEPSTEVLPSFFQNLQFYNDWRWKEYERTINKKFNVFKKIRDYNLEPELWRFYYFLIHSLFFIYYENYLIFII